MALPYFYVSALGEHNILLDEDTSKHMIGVLRMQKGSEALLTDGKGKKVVVMITDDNRKRCAVQLTSINEEPPPSHKVVIGISLIKNASRFEWFLEKATEIGVTEIIPLLCERTEKEKFRYDRLQQILISAMLQSQQCRLPNLHQPSVYKEVIAGDNTGRKFIAHCLDESKEQLAGQTGGHARDQLILIGPEGDFTPQEVELALQNGYQPVALGNTRLRTETAGIVAATLLCQASPFPSGGGAQVR
jgi:16S rRNA (uracil1498-N3)-methyltransferase